MEGTHDRKIHSFVAFQSNNPFLLKPNFYFMKNALVILILSTLLFSCKETENRNAPKLESDRIQKRLDRPRRHHSDHGFNLSLQT